MDIITRFALESNPIQINALVAVLNAFQKKGIGNVNHVAAVLLGLEGYTPNLPAHAILNNGEARARFVEYDLLTDEVKYEYDQKCTLYFKNEADAEVYASGGNYYGLDYKYGPREGYEVAGSRMVVSNGYVLRSEWLENAV